MILKHGQLCTIDNYVYRAKKKTAGCNGCYFEDAQWMCPGVVYRNRGQKINCQLNGIILEKL